VATKKPPLAIIAAARRHMAHVVEWTRGMDAASYQADVRTRYACERAFIAIGEALADLGGKVELTALAPGGPWVDPVRFRHFLAHDYDDQAIPPLVWDTIIHDLPELDAALAGLEVVLGRKGASRPDGKSICCRPVLFQQFSHSVEPIGGRLDCIQAAHALEGVACPPRTTHRARRPCSLDASPRVSPGMLGASKVTSMMRSPFFAPMLEWSELAGSTHDRGQLMRS